MRHHSKNEKNRIQDQMLDVVTVVDDGDDARRAPCGESQLYQLTFLPPASLAQVKTGVFAAPQAQTNPSSLLQRLRPCQQCQQSESAPWPRATAIVGTQSDRNVA